MLILLQKSRVAEDRLHPTYELLNCPHVQHHQKIVQSKTQKSEGALVLA